MKLITYLLIIYFLFYCVLLSIPANADVVDAIYRSDSHVTCSTDDEMDITECHVPSDFEYMNETGV